MCSMWKKKWIENGCISFAFKYTWNVLHINSSVLGFRGWGYFCDQIVFAESQDFDRYSSKYMAICLHHKKLEMKVLHLHKIQV